MSIYKELNDVKLDVSCYEQEPLTALEQKQWEQRVKSKLRPRRKRLPIKRKAAALTAAALMILLAMSLPQVSLARIPVVGGLIENFNSNHNALQADYSSYKTAVRETAENEYGKLTLNEVLVDADRLLISSTLQPAQGMRFDYKTHLPVEVMIHGERRQLSAMSQSVQEDDGSYTVYGDVSFSDLPLPENKLLDLQIAYHTVNRGAQSMTLEQPWVFDVQLSAEAMSQDTKTVEIHKTLDLNGQGTVTVRKVVFTPVSTLLYFDASEETQSVSFKLTSIRDGSEIPLSTVTLTHEPGTASYARFWSANALQGPYQLTPVDGMDHELELGSGLILE
ncbi:DUF4179 domain-containing protein [Paenibacillus sp. F411]|uniref:DUF4179 domain-containing protein n=1 Tax=Paenibacillus sp. F411 TaxID=2820239 RepID=UPI001AAED365|nr:DUF4179 domain-containing protein [Paenibacillus sp. F411]MBO2944320.1 DUF4179 domain-containing protein [Paenibacillus sp. F411]